MGRKQLEISGTERAGYDEEIAKKAATYIEARDARMELTKKEVDAKTDLLTAMKERKLESYEDDDFIVNFEAEVTEKLKAKRRSVPGDEIDVEA